MAIHEGLDIRYWTPRNGFLVQGKGDTERKVKGISGTLSRIDVKDDPGDATRKIAPGRKYNVSLQDGDSIEVISVRAETTFGWMLACSLAAVKPNDPILVEISHGDDEKVNFAWVKSYKDGKKGDLTRPEYPKDRDEKIAQGIADMLNHPALHGTAEEADYDPFLDE